ncbi:MAG: MATE family efflux transporter [Helicobacteraceae bacterium]|nr:MATE family efflux transporter [Helicobacteraceae bacterium]
MPFFCKERFIRVIALALPAALGALIDMTQVLIDFYLVGYLGVSETAAIGIALQFTGLFYTVMSIFFIGSNALMSRFLGAKEIDKAGDVLSVFTLALLLLSLPAIACGALFAEFPFTLMRSDPKVEELGASYLFAMSFALPAMMVNQIAFSAFSAAANIKTPLFIKLFSNFVNIALSFILIFGEAGVPNGGAINVVFSPLFKIAGAFGIEGYGVAGAAAGTAATFYLESLCYFFLIVVRKKPFRSHLSFDFRLLLRGLNVGVPAGVERLIGYGSFLVFMRIVSDFGTEVMAGYQIGLRVESIVFMPGIGFTIAAMSLTGRALGAKNTLEAEKDALFTTFGAAIIMGAAGVLMALFALPLASVFSDDQGAIKAAEQYLVCMGLSQLPLGACFVLSGAFRGAGDSRTSLKINTLSMWIFRIVPAVAFALIWESIIAVWIVTLVETWIRGVWLLWVFKKGRWKTIKV